MASTAVTIGNFDGVHRGHAALIGRARKAVGPDGRVVVLSFDPHPTRVLSPGCEPARLTTFQRRADLLREAGADEVRRLEPDSALLSLGPAEFMGHVVRDFKPAVLVEGADFRFGKGRTGDAAALREIGRQLGFGLEVVEPVEVALYDHSLVPASSSIARWLLANGRVADTALVLGRAHELSGPVGPGDRRGRGIGFPTANLSPAEATPAAGVYACVAVLPDGREKPAATHVGERPTFGDGDRRVEAHILGLPTSFDPTQRAIGDRPPPAAAAGWAPIADLDETGWPLRLRFCHWLRDPIAFGSLGALRAQLARDCERTLEAFGRPPVAARPEEIHA